LGVSEQTPSQGQGELSSPQTVPMFRPQVSSIVKINHRVPEILSC